MSKDNDEIMAEEVTVSSDNDEESSGRMSSISYCELKYGTIKTCENFGTF